MMKNSFAAIISCLLSWTTKIAWGFSPVAPSVLPHQPKKPLSPALYFDDQRVNEVYAASSIPTTTEPVRGRTENMAPTYINTGSNCLNLFFDAVPGISRDELRILLDKAWEEDSSTALKLIFQLGDPRKGKGDRKNLYQGLLWLYENNFETLLLNLDLIPRFSYYKTLLDLLQLACEGADALDDKRPPRLDFYEWTDRELGRLYWSKDWSKWKVEEFYKTLPASVTKDWTVDTVKVEGRWATSQLRDLFIEYKLKEDQLLSQEARILRRQRNLALASHAQNMYNTNTNYRLLYDKVAKMFAQALQQEKDKLDGSKSISGLPAKWAPTLKGAHDRHTKIVDGIVARLYSLESTTISGQSHEMLRDRYRREYLSPQRRAAQVPEFFIGSSDWQLVNYKRMASRCRLLHGHVFEKHDKERYNKYLEAAKGQVETGEKITMISAGALLPHEITTRANQQPESMGELGLQWLRLVQDTKQQGKLPSAVAVCDVSGSMAGQPMEVAIALSMLVSDLAGGPWKNKLVPFSREPSLVSIPAATVDNLVDRYRTVKGMAWGFNTDFQAVFDLLLDAASFFSVKPTDMPSTVFCFSDMEFDDAHEGDWKTDVELIREKYAKKGYKVPELVFWNLRASQSKPVSYSEPGVALLSGFSAGLMKSFLAYRLEELTPINQLKKALTPYKSLVVSPENAGVNPEEGKKKDPTKLIRNFFDFLFGLSKK